MVSFLFYIITELLVYNTYNNVKIRSFKKYIVYFSTALTIDVYLEIEDTDNLNEVTNYNNVLFSDSRGISNILFIKKIKKPCI